MTAHPIDTEALRARAEHVYRHGGPANAVESLAANIPEILDRLAAAEHRATRAEAQRDQARQARDVLIEAQQVPICRAKAAEARIQAVQDVLDKVEAGQSWSRPVDFSGTPFPLDVDTADIRRALDA